MNRFLILIAFLLLYKIQNSQVFTSTSVVTSAANNTVTGAPWSNFFGNVGFFVATAQFPSLPTGSLTQGLNLTNFGFSIPLTATIVGIQASVSYSANFSKDTITRLLISGVETGNNLGGSVTSPGYLTPIIYGSNTNLWGISNLFPSDINSTNFGLCLYLKGKSGFSGYLVFASAILYGPIITVYYTNSASGIIEHQTNSPNIFICGENTLCIDKTQNIKYEIQIFNSLGQLERKEILLDVSRIENLDLLNGVYYIKYKTSDQEFCKKILINK